MKAFISLLLVCCLFGINEGQLTTSQITGSWIDDGTNSALNAACCAPVATAASPLLVVAPSTTTVTTSGTWGSTTACDNLGLKGVAIASTGQTLTSTAAANSFPIAFTYKYTATSASFAGTTDASANAQGVATLQYTMNSVVCTYTLNVPTGTTFTKATASTYTQQWTGTVTQTASCCAPVLATAQGTDASNNVKTTYSGTALTVAWTWDTSNAVSAAACKVQGLSGSATTTIATFTAPTATFTTITTGAYSVDGLSSATASAWNYVTNAQSCTYNLKKNSSAASHLAASFAGLLLFFVAYL